MIYKGFRSGRSIVVEEFTSVYGEISVNLRPTQLV